MHHFVSHINSWILFSVFLLYEHSFVFPLCVWIIFATNLPIQNVVEHLYYFYILHISMLMLRWLFKNKSRLYFVYKYIYGTKKQVVNKFHCINTLCTNIHLDHKCYQKFNVWLLNAIDLHLNLLQIVPYIHLKKLH